MSFFNRTSNRNMGGDNFDNHSATTPFPDAPDVLNNNESSHFDGPMPGTMEALSMLHGGRYYTVPIFAPSLGVKFVTAPSLPPSTIYLNPPPHLINALGDLPVVAYVFGESAARQAGIGIGHVLVRIDDMDIYGIKDVAVIMKNRGRPCTCEFYIPRTEIVKSEGPALVKYDTKTTNVSTKLKDWKFKYIVIGGIISPPYVLRMYQSRAEYDRAVIETQAGKHVTVKIKTIPLRFARILDDYGDPKEVQIKEKPTPWRYIVLMPGNGSHPVKIAAPTLAKLRPLHDAIRRVIAELDAVDMGPDERTSYGSAQYGEAGSAEMWEGSADGLSRGSGGSGRGSIDRGANEGYVDDYLDDGSQR